MLGSRSICLKGKRLIIYPANYHLKGPYVWIGIWIAQTQKGKRFLTAEYRVPSYGAQFLDNFAKHEGVEI